MSRVLSRSNDIALGLNDKGEALRQIAPLVVLQAEKLALQLSPDKHPFILAVIEQIPSLSHTLKDADKAKCLSAFAPKLSAGLFPDALRLLKDNFTTYRDRTEAFCNLTPYLPQDQFPAALQLIASSIHPPHDQVTALQALIPFLPLNLLDQVFKHLHISQLAETANRFAITLPNLQAQVLDSIATALSAQQPPMQDSGEFANTLTSLVTQTLTLTQQLHPYECQTFSYETAAAHIFSQLAPATQNLQNLGQPFPGTGRQTVLQCIPETFQDDWGYRAQVLKAFVRVIPAPEPGQTAQLPHDIQTHLKAFPEDNRSTFLTLQVRTASPYIFEHDELRSLIKRLKKNPKRYSDAVVELACHPQGHSYQTQALRIIRNLPPHLQRAHLQHLIPSLQPNQCLEAANIIREMSDSHDKACSFVYLASAHATFRPEAKSIINQLEKPIQRLEQLSHLAIEMPELLPEIIDLAKEEIEEAHWAKALVALRHHLPARIDREVDRERAFGRSITPELWQRALYLLARSYRDALKGGSFRNESVQADDLLNLKDEVDALADMLLMRDLEPPMTVGILGGWGGGKSYIMHLMQIAMTHVRSRKVEAVETWNPDPNSEKLSPYVGHIYQIKFDAWTFAKSNLWASLMHTIFFELNRQISLEQQLSYVLANNPDHENDRRKALCEAGNYWAVLYKTDKDERQYFLERVLPGQLDRLKAIQNQGKFEDELWQQFGDTYRDESKKLADLQQALADTTRELTEHKQTITASVEEALIHQVLQLPAIAPVTAILSSRVSEEAFQALTDDIKGAIAEQMKNDENAQQAIATTDIEQLRAIVKALAIRVIERRAGQLSFASFLTWFKQNLRLFGLFMFFLLLALLLPIAVEQILGWVLPSVDTLVARMVAFLAPLAPGMATAQNLLQGARKWFTETDLAVKEYETQLQLIPEQIEARKSARIQATIEQDPQVLELETTIQTLQQRIVEQEQRIPQNIYTSLEEFVSDRLQPDSYNKDLGIMHRVKDDLADLSRRFLPPPATSREFQAKLEQLQKIFPRGPARVVVYIDDLDRCPPKRVVEVLEAVQLLVKTPLFIAVLAIDERYITRALEKYYDGVLSRRGRPSGTDYLEKIIQLPYRVRPITPAALETYLKAQVVLQDSGTSGTKFSEVSRQEFDMLLRCCRQTHLSPRTLKRLTNVYKLFKVVCRTRGTKPKTHVQQAILALLALSGRYPHLMRSIFDIIEVCYEEARTQDEVKKLMEDSQKRAWAEKHGRLLHLDSSLKDFFRQYSLPTGDRYLQREIDKLQHDALETGILPDGLTLRTMTHEIFNLIRSFSFVGEIGEDPQEGWDDGSST